jgi:hypothetical protein
MHCATPCNARGGEGHDTPNTTIWGNVFQITVSTTPSCFSFPLLLLLHKSLSALNMHQGLAAVVGALLCMVNIFVFTFIFHTVFGQMIAAPNRPQLLSASVLMVICCCIKHHTQWLPYKTKAYP